jgi:primosomal replication protein N
MEKTLNNNQVTVAGEIASDFTFSHEIFGEGFYMVDLVVARLSDTYDIIPLMVSDRLFDVENSHILSVFVREISVIEDEDDMENKPNQIYLDGFICKEPIYRMTPLGREIADILLAVNRAYGKSDYIPCICWGRNARFAGKLKVGEHVAVWGRIQSREYQKRIGNDQIISKTAYEVSVSKMECLE